jgi:hypothetical protein
MFKHLYWGAALVVLSATVAAAQPKDFQVLKDVAAKVDGYTQFTSSTTSMPV